MKDAFERRALLLHLGDALQAIAAALATSAAHDTLRDLRNADASLAAHAWFAAISRDMKAADFAKRASAAFAAWPALLLEEQVDYTRLALAVRSHLFAEDPSGWRSYVEAIKREVEWFGDALPSANEPAQADETAGDAQASDEAIANDTTDVERVEEPRDPQRESVESNDRLYPSWPWKPGI
ncbi:hypothetical protein PPMP20_07865 [Paraburkholderia phymatum]|uniref:Uncharacterized protein n=1 Tax=Paraburkholderia phymatum (strain DSM 17167 / CIP 108236 / LMG 21445 / STM815) TaxID=391038 RepID=B2JHQ0_PARP8|nr:hypothetical protein [Paraburkholderia phymatum]ACC70392.1 conserved hypothetical protein [Paraburkholderia phymatum STM815]